MFDKQLRAGLTGGISSGASARALVGGKGQCMSSFSAFRLSSAVLAFACAFLLAQSSYAANRCGAIAVSFEDRSHYGAKGFRDCSQAELKVLRACSEESAGKCKAFTCFNSCCAIALKGSGKTAGFGTGTGSSQQAAEAEALQTCANSAGAGCQIRRSHCNFGDPGKIDDN